MPVKAVLAHFSVNANINNRVHVWNTFVHTCTPYQRSLNRCELRDGKHFFEEKKTRAHILRSLNFMHTIVLNCSEHTYSVYIHSNRSKLKRENKYTHSRICFKKE